MFWFYSDDTSNDLKIEGPATEGGSRIAFPAANENIYMSLNGGNVLIGKNSQYNPVYRLDVAGKVRADGIVVNTDGADFVFDKDYSLPSLSNVETYIQENKHLPEIPSAQDMQKEGMNVGDLQTKLLQKIEELTLYVIEQQKQIDLLKVELRKEQSKKTK